jgi:hypothetical protein
MTKNETLLHDLQHQIGNSDRRHVALYSALIGLQHMREKIEIVALAYLEHKSSNVLSDCEPQNAADAYAIGWARGEGGDLLELSKLHASIALLESNPDVQAAVANLEPLCQERTRLRALVAQEAAELAQAQAAAAEAVRAAIERATATAANCPEVRAAAERLAALSNPQAPAPPRKAKVPDQAQEMSLDIHH